MNLNDKIKIILENAKVDAIWVTNCYNVRYLTQFSGTFGHCIISKKGHYFFTDSRYELIAKECVPKEFNIVKVTKNFTDEICACLKSMDIAQVGLEAYELSYLRVEALKKLLELEVKTLDNVILKCREIKTAEEIEYISKAAAIADEAFSRTLEYLQVGMSEREIAAFLEYQMKLLGSENPSFDTIVASGYRSSMPHGVASDKKVQRGELITFDFGATYHGYASDMTRTLFLGRDIPAEMERVYMAVLRAQELALTKIEVGMKMCDIDSIARESLKAEGLGENFTHGLGHALGLEIHEPPYVNSASESMVEEGMVFTIEPGAYLENQFGVRIEDDVAILKEGIKILNKTSKKLICLDK